MTTSVSATTVSAVSAMIVNRRRRMVTMPAMVIPADGGPTSAALGCG